MLLGNGAGAPMHLQKRMSRFGLSLLHVHKQVVRNNCCTSSKLQASRKWSGNGLGSSGKTSTTQKEGENSGSETQWKGGGDVLINEQESQPFQRDSYLHTRTALLLSLNRQHSCHRVPQGERFTHITVRKQQSGFQ